MIGYVMAMQAVLLMRMKYVTSIIQTMTMISLRTILSAQKIPVKSIQTYCVMEKIIAQMGQMRNLVVTNM